MDSLNANFGNQIDPDLFTVGVRVKDPKDVDYVREQVLATFQRFTDELVDQATLEASRSRMRYAFALRMNSSTAIANALVPYIGLRRTPETINKLFDLYGRITPEDIREMATRYFTEKNRTVVTLQYKPLNQDSKSKD